MLDTKEFRAALGRFLSGITVVSTRVGADIHGMTASSFISVSLDPPLVLVAVNKKARFYQYAQQSGAYGVSILSAEQQSWSDHFAGKPQADAPPWVEDGFITPVLAGSLAVLDCTLESVVEAGDHGLFLGRVQQLRVGEGAPLGYFRGRYLQNVQNS